MPEIATIEIRPVRKDTSMRWYRMLPTVVWLLAAVLLVGSLVALP